MDTLRKIELLAEGAKYEVCTSFGVKEDPKALIYLAILPNGRTFPLLKILMDNACRNNCTYCFQRQKRNYPRTSINPEELANIFINLVKRHLVEGLFLSSGISSSPNETMEKMLICAEIIRKKQGFKGYIHLKILPGVNLDYVEWAVKLADRVSLNLEAPNQERLQRIAPEKDFSALLVPMERAADLIRQKKGRARSQTTQFVVGADNESDYELLKATSELYKKFGLFRAYFSAFRPIPHTPLENHPATPPIREHRLYQADFLLRQYGFSFSELVFEKNGNLSQRYDPKMAWALNHPERFPIEVNKAEYHELLRVPGIGPLSAWRIVTERTKHRFKTKEELKGCGVVLKRALPFLFLA